MYDIYLIILLFDEFYSIYKILFILNSIFSSATTFEESEERLNFFKDRY